jgi:cytochrome d ubiquinol oxidase subunit I
MASAAFVVMVNAWMNTPRGVVLAGGRIVAVDPIVGMLTPPTGQQALHMVLAAYAATGIAVAGVHAIPRQHAPPSSALVAEHRRARGRAASSRRRSARRSRNAARQARGAPGQFDTEAAPLRTAAGPIDARHSLAIEIPRGLSLLAFHDPSARVKVCPSST